MSLFLAMAKILIFLNTSSKSMKQLEKRQLFLCQNDHIYKTYNKRIIYSLHIQVLVLKKNGCFLYSLFLFLEMVSLDIVFFRSLSPEKLMIKIWDFANHVHHVMPHEKESCSCRHYLNLCTDAAREQQREDYIYFDTAIYRLQFHRKELVDMMSTDNEIFLDHLVRCYKRDV